MIPRGTGQQCEPSTGQLPAKAGSLHIIGWRGDDAELLKRLQTDAGAGAVLLHDRYAADVNRLVWRLLGADADHDDLVQQVFVRLLRNAHLVREAEKLSGWVQTVTINTVYSELRKRGVRRLFLREHALETERFADLCENVESRDLLTKIYSLLEKMPARERLVFSLRYIEERSIKEVAELLNCSLATAKRRLCQANERFARLTSAHPEIASRIAQRLNGRTLKSGIGVSGQSEFSDGSEDD